MIDAPLTREQAEFANALRIFADENGIHISRGSGIWNLFELLAAGRAHIVIPAPSAEPASGEQERGEFDTMLKQINEAERRFGVLILTVEQKATILRWQARAAAPPSPNRERQDGR